MSGMSVSGKIMVQEAQASGFDAHVYPDHVSAAIQLLRTAIRRSRDEGVAIAQVEQAVADLIESEKADIEDDGDD